MTMVYVLVTAALVHIVLFACMLVFAARCLVDHRPTDLQLQVNAPTSTHTVVQR